MGTYILAIDQGTTGSTCLIVEMSGTRPGQVVARGYSEVPQHFPRPGWVEHDLEEIWTSVCQSITRALDKAPCQPREIAAIGITNQRETVGMWTASGTPLGRAIVWQDRRTSTRCQQLKDEDQEAWISKRTGLCLDPYFSATKIGWMLEQNSQARASMQHKTLRLGTMDTWVLWRLTQGKSYKTDVTNASRTLLYDMHRLAWDLQLCELFCAPSPQALPEVCASNAHFGVTCGLPMLPDGIPITGVAGDQQAALFGQACFEPGLAKCTFGTGAFVLVNIGDKPLTSQSGLICSPAWQLGTRTTYALEGSTFVAGAIVQWLRDGLQIIQASDDIEDLAKQVDDTQGVTLVPALTGLGAPHWRPEARGLLSGITRGTTRAHIARAALEGIAWQVADLFECIRRESPYPLTQLRADGGAAANNLLMQFTADILQLRLDRPSILDSTAWGAACMAALGAHICNDVAEIQQAMQLSQSFSPSMSPDEVARRAKAWRHAVTLA